MNTKAKFLTSTVAAVLSASTVFAASSAFASPRDSDQYLRNKISQTWSRDRDGQYRNGRDNGRFEYRNDRNNGRYNRRTDYPRSFTRLPNGYRRVMYRNRPYYTLNNDAYYSYNSSTRSFVLINLPGISIGF
jgi:Ni/Co efflux regulator RcnB